jgi:iron complex outermembrane recepter protein
VQFGYTLLQEDLRVKPGRNDLNSGQGELFDPQQQLQLRSSWDFSDAVELDVWLRYVDRIVNTARGFQTVPDYLTLDARIGWSLLKHLELTLVGQNLLDKQHLEFGFRQIERSVYGKATWRF